LNIVVNIDSSSILSCLEQTKIISLSPPCARGFVSWHADINSKNSKNKVFIHFLSKDQ